MYVFEPCRMKPRPRARTDGIFFGRDCFSWATEVPRCGISLSGYRMLRRGAGAFKAQSSANSAITEAEDSPKKCKRKWMSTRQASHRSRRGACVHGLVAPVLEPPRWFAFR